MSDLASRIKELRKTNNLSQKQLADKLKVSQVAITHWENRSREPSISTIEQMAKIFHVTPAYMVGWDELKEKKPDEINAKLEHKAPFPPLKPGEFIIDITRENYEKYPEYFDLIFKKLDEIEPFKFNGFIIDTQTGRIAKPTTFSELTKQFTIDDNLEILKDMNVEIRYDPKLNLLTVKC